MRTVLRTEDVKDCVDKILHTDRLLKNHAVLGDWARFTLETFPNPPSAAGSYIKTPFNMNIVCFL